MEVPILSRSPFLRHTDPSDERRLSVGVIALRLELLRMVTEYGVEAVFAGGSREDARRWCLWLEWLIGVFGPAAAAASKLGLEADSADSEYRLSIPGLLDRLREFEEADHSTRGDWFDVESHAYWLEGLERLASRAREMEELGAEPLGEEEGHEFGAGVRLLGAIEDSLVLQLVDHDQPGQALTASETYELAVAARDEGVWDYVNEL